jgi:signal transduction histidine kinase/CheY-like chemotaxis protein
MSNCPRQLAQYDPRSLLNSQPVIVTVIDPDTHRVQFQNTTGTAKFGDITDMRCHDKIAESASPCAFCKMPETVATGQMTSNEVPLPNGQYLLVQWAKTVTADGRTHVIESITDISERKRMEQALTQSQKMEAVGRLAGGIAHDFNNLLTIINGQCDLLMDQLAYHPAGKQLAAVREAGGRASALTKKLLAFARHEFLEQRVVSINTIIKELLPLLQRFIGEHIEIVTRLDETAGEIRVDPVQFEQVLMNLALNARDAMPRGGMLALETKSVAILASTTSVYTGPPSGDYVRVSVKDTGCGMDKDTLSHVFEPFFSTKGPGHGTGLGLATVYGLVKQNGGYVEVASEVGKGSLFTILIPRIAPQTEYATPSPAVTIKSTILVVEDEKGVRDFISGVLRQLGYTVLEAGDGEEALALLKLHRDTCALIVTDVIMPRLNGPALVERLRVASPGLKVLYVSGYTGDTIKQNGLSAKEPFLQKPFAPQALTYKVTELLA